MSRRKDNYENSKWLKFKRWVDGEIDPLACGIETETPDWEGVGEAGKDRGRAGYKTGSGTMQETMTEVMAGNLPDYEAERVSESYRQAEWEEQESALRIFRRIYQVMSVFLCTGIIAVLLWTVAYLPVFGNAGNPDNNEVSARYIEQGLDETGAVNIVTGMILDYRAFDTFGEPSVL